MYSILVVDDDIDIENMLEEALVKEGYIATEPKSMK